MIDVNSYEIVVACKVKKRKKEKEAYLKNNVVFLSKLTP